MTLNEYYMTYGLDGLRELAKRAGTKVSYLLQLNYDSSKRPSLQMAQRIVEASGGVITLDDLANPTFKRKRK